MLSQEVGELMYSKDKTCRAPPSLPVVNQHCKLMRMQCVRCEKGKAVIN